MGKRRANGEGTIFQRKDGRWVAQFMVAGKWLYKYAHRQSDCRDWLLEMRRRHADGLLLDASGTTVSGFMDHWLDTAQASLRPRTALQYRQVIRQHIAPHLGAVKLRDLGAAQVQGLYTRLVAAGVGLRTVQMVHVILHRALGQAVRWGLVGRNATEGVDRPRVERREATTLTVDQVKRLLAAVAGTRWEALYHLAVYVGLRQGELLGLRWSDIDGNVGRISVARQVQRVAGQGLVFCEPKSRMSRRAVSIGPATLGLLREHRVRIDELRLLAGARWQEQDLLFPSVVGTPMNARNLLRQFHSVLARAGLPAVRFHDLRHTSATLLLNEGVHPKLVQARLGHSQIGLTMDTYSHVLPAVDGAVATVIERIIESGGLAGTQVVH